jgi:hypothetical protein
MYSVINNVEKLVASVNDVAETKIAILKLKAAGKVSASLSSLVNIIMVALFGSVALTIVSFGFAYLIGSKLNNLSYGFFIIGGLYALAGLLFFINRKKWVQIPFSNLFIDKLMQ